MFAAVDDIHHRHRKNVGIDSADVAVKRKSTRIGGCFGNCEADAQYRIRTKIGFVRSTVEINHHRIDVFLILCVEINQRVRNRAIDCGDRLKNAFAHVSRHVSVAFLGGFIRSG